MKSLPHADLMRAIRISTSEPRRLAAGRELDRREILWRLYECAIDPGPGVVRTRSYGGTPQTCRLCEKPILPGEVYCDELSWAGEKLFAHYDCVPGLGPDFEPWMVERREILERARQVWEAAICYGDSRLGAHDFDDEGVCKRCGGHGPPSVEAVPA